MPSKKTAAQPATPAAPSKEPKGQKQIAPADLKKLQDVVTRLISKLGSARDGAFETWDSMYRLETGELPVNSDYVKPCVSPRPHDVPEMIARMYAGQVPRVDVMAVTEEERAAADKLRRFLTAVLLNNQPFKLLSDLLRAVSIFDEESIIIDPWYQFDAQAEKPFVLYVPHPKSCYVAYGRRGMLRHVLRVDMTLQDVIDSYGETDTKFLLAKNLEEDKILTVIDVLDKQCRAVWCTDYPDEPIRAVTHGLGWIPRQASLGTAPSWEEDEANRRMSVMYSLDKANLWASETLMLTAALSATLTYANPQWVKKSNDPGKDTNYTINLSETGKVHVIGSDEDIQPLKKELIPKEVMEMLAQIETLSEVSTLPKIMAGTAPFAGVTASATHTLSTNARLIAAPIVAVANAALTEALSIVTRMFIKAGEKVSVYGVEGLASLAPSEIKVLGERPRITAELLPDLAMERQININLATALAGIGVGEATIYDILEDSGVVRSAESARKEALVSKFVAAFLPEYVKNAMQQVQGAMNKPEIPGAASATGAALEQSVAGAPAPVEPNRIDQATGQVLPPAGGSRPIETLAGGHMPIEPGT